MIWSVAMHGLRTYALAASLIGAASVLGGCATHPDKVEAAFVPVSKYQHLNCEQLAAETHRIIERTVDLYAHMAEQDREDSGQFVLNSLTFPGVAYILADLVLMSGTDKKAEEELSRLKGDFESLRQNALRRSCDFEVLSADEADTKDKQAGVASEFHDAGS